jgi:hypothetical protein
MSNETIQSSIKGAVVLVYLTTGGNTIHYSPEFIHYRIYFLSDWNCLRTIGNSVVWMQLNRPLVTHNCLLRSSKCLPNHVIASVRYSSHPLINV